MGLSSRGRPQAGHPGVAHSYHTDLCGSVGKSFFAVIDQTKLCDRNAKRAKPRAAMLFRYRFVGNKRIGWSEADSFLVLAGEGPPSTTCSVSTKSWVTGLRRPD